jgi:hypothetical protein
MKKSFIHWILIVAIILSVSYTYYRTVVLQDFHVTNIAGKPTDPNQLDHAL